MPIKPLIENHKYLRLIAPTKGFAIAEATE